MVILQSLELGFTVGPALFPVLQIIKLGGILCANRSNIFLLYMVFYQTGLMYRYRLNFCL